MSYRQVRDVLERVRLAEQEMITIIDRSRFLGEADSVSKPHTLGRAVVFEQVLKDCLAGEDEGVLKT